MAGAPHWKPSTLSTPAAVSETRVVVPAPASRTKISQRPFVSAGTRLEAFDTKAVKRPSADVAAEKLPLSPCSPVDETDKRLKGPPCASAAATGTSASVSATTLTRATRRVVLFKIPLPPKAT